MTIADFTLRGARALVTGASKGIGRAIALAFAEAGADVAVAARGVTDLERVANEIRALGRAAVPIQADLSKPADIDRLAAAAPAGLGGLDILVNNAGIIGPASSIYELCGSAFDEVMRVNVYGPLRLSQHCRRAMQQSGAGVIINITSIGAMRPIAGVGFYWASKAALVNMTKLMAIEWAADRIRCVAIAPGVIRTDMGAPYIERLKQAGIRKTLLGEFGEPEDVAALAVYLASAAGRYANAATYTLDGGTLAMAAVG